jgi:hypothetical protein
MQGWIDTCKSLSEIHHINRSKDKNHLIISIDKEKPWKYSISFHDKNYDETRTRMNVSQDNMGYISQESETRKGCPLSPLLLKIVLEFFDTAIVWMKK